jgi:SAM-dependent methyltransferase
MNREGYNAIAPAWDAARVAFYGHEREYPDALLDGLPVGSDVLDLGCGTGRPLAEYLLARGHRVTGVDQAEALLALDMLAGLGFVPVVAEFMYLPASGRDKGRYAVVARMGRPFAPADAPPASR